MAILSRRRSLAQYGSRNAWGAGKTVLAIAPDTGEWYLSTPPYRFD
ncbi:MAG: hypothetical protein LBD58_07640 [Treponema sp.]|nr:hypothetical protein [Treponema sp.]